ncbi:hypothetical protein [Streptomyces albipurpureus]|uniref:Uncharacterized protein n=1 Tax=Streptomyces albipurpureus TaxID=2897419 RepID=A0ABT0UPG7_9ACTN|nr:hypothetical protein [Streptomyces sp. CWNU-1]MCM2390241.1 hypothetical protein [Streptomyces sp. CWNU-1]
MTWNEWEQAKAESLAAIRHGPVPTNSPPKPAAVRGTSSSICKIAGSEPGQLEGLPFNAYIHDTLTGSTSHRERFTLLLAATQKALKGMGCENNPVIPDTPPPAVK